VRGGAPAGAGSAAVPLDAASLASLGRFASRATPLRRAALRALAATLPRASLPDVADQYAALDADGDGRVTRRELAAALLRMSAAARRAAARGEGIGTENENGGANDTNEGSSSLSDGDADENEEESEGAAQLLSDEEVDAALDALDPDGDGVVSFRDYAAAVLTRRHIWPEEAEAGAEHARTPAAAAAARARVRLRARAAFDRVRAPSVNMRFLRSFTLTRPSIRAAAGPRRRWLHRLR
jgi:hypothetical protein